MKRRNNTLSEAEVMALIESTDYCTLTYKVTSIRVQRTAITEAAQVCADWSPAMYDHFERRLCQTLDEFNLLFKRTLELHVRQFTPVQSDEAMHAICLLRAMESSRVSERTL